MPQALQHGSCEANLRQLSPWALPFLSLALPVPRCVCLGMCTFPHLTGPARSSHMVTPSMPLWAMHLLLSFATQASFGLPQARRRGPCLCSPSYSLSAISMDLPPSCRWHSPRSSAVVRVGMEASLDLAPRGTPMGRLQHAHVAHVSAPNVRHIGFCRIALGPLTGPAPLIPGPPTRVISQNPFAQKPFQKTFAHAHVRSICASSWPCPL